MRYGAAVARRLELFGKERSGSFAILMAMVVAVLSLSAGYALNLAQIYNARSGLKNALDAAVTSSAREIISGTNIEDARDLVERFLKTNGDPTFASGDKLVLDRLTIDKAKSKIEVAGHVDVDLYFPLFGLSNERRVTSVSAAVYSDKKIEVAMMLDVTGSMKGDKIEDLKDAASNAVTQLLQYQDQKNPRVRVAIVPYAEAVNTGNLAVAVFVEKRNGSNTPPAIDQAISASAGAPDKCATERKKANGTADFTDDGPDTKRTYTEKRKVKTYLARVNRDDRLEVCPKAELIALTADQKELLDTIEDFKADGVTAGGIAVQWGYYMLSPKWRDAIKDAGMGAGPADHNEKKVSKVAILMTDGQFNTAFAGVKDSNDEDNQPQMDQGAKSRSYAESLCANMRKDGIEIFTIGFALDDRLMKREEREQAKSVLRNCATADSGAIKHYFEALTGEELDNAFREIIANTERLALTK
jgi:Flp pilus assembly protein TadG